MLSSTAETQQPNLEEHGTGSLPRRLARSLGTAVDKGVVAFSCIRPAVAAPRLRQSHVSPAACCPAGAVTIPVEVDIEVELTHRTRALEMRASIDTNARISNHRGNTAHPSQCFDGCSLHGHAVHLAQHVCDGNAGECTMGVWRSPSL